MVCAIADSVVISAFGIPLTNGAKGMALQKVAVHTPKRYQQAGINAIFELITCWLPTANVFGSFGGLKSPNQRTLSSFQLSVL